MLPILPFYLWLELQAGLKLETKLYNLSKFISGIIYSHSHATSYYPIFFIFHPICKRDFCVNTYMYNYKDCLIEDKKFNTIGNKI